MGYFVMIDTLIEAALKNVFCFFVRKRGGVKFTFKGERNNSLDTQDEKALMGCALNNMVVLK